VFWTWVTLGVTHGEVLLVVQTLGVTPMDAWTRRGAFLPPGGFVVMFFFSSWLASSFLYVLWLLEVSVVTA
jgi:hypothetical protein